MDGSSGSPNSGEPMFLVIGRLRRPHGVMGEISMEVLTDFPERIGKGSTLLVGDSHREMAIEGIRPHGDGLLIKFFGMNDRDSVGVLRNEMVYKQADNLPELPEGEFYHHQLVGLKVISEDGSSLGELREILETGANDVYRVVAEDGKELLLPAIESVILEVKLDEGCMTVRLQEWL
jgi:16S rRNA processing protein RimM